MSYAAFNRPEMRTPVMVLPGDRQTRSPKSRQMLSSLALGLLCLLVLTIPLENAVFLPGLGCLGRIVGLAAFVIAALALLDAGKLRTLSAAHLMMAAYVVWATLTYFWSEAPAGTLEQVSSYVQLLIMVWLIWQLAPQRSDRVRLMQAYLLG